jgi:hypothetical protein
MLPEISLLEEALRGHLGLKFGKLILKEFMLTSTYKYPQGHMIRKTTITEVVRDGIVTKIYKKKCSTHVI